MRRSLALLLASASVAAGCDRPRRPAAAPPVEAPPSPPEVDAEGSVGTPEEQARRPSSLVVSPRGVVLPALAREGGGYRVSTPCGGTVVTPATPVGPFDVVLDPGHGGSEPGATGPNGLVEKDLNLAVAVVAARQLQAAGVAVVLTRRGDYRMTLAARGLVAKASGARAMVSIHHNAGSVGPSPAPGTEVYIQQGVDAARRLGGLVYQEVSGTFAGTTGISFVSGGNPGVRVRTGRTGADFYGILRAAPEVPTILAEGAYLSNRSEAAALARPQVQEAEGRAIARAVVRFLRTDQEGTGFTGPSPLTGPAGPGGGGAGCEDPLL